MNKLVLLFLACFCTIASAQDCYWQQGVEYAIDVDFDIEKHQYEIDQKMIFHNNSPDTLKELFFHAFLNAFQPYSDMDIRSHTIADPDRRVGKRIRALTSSEIGFHEIHWIKSEHKKLDFNVEGTIVHVFLDQAILPHSSINLQLQYKSQIPIQIRRNGRNNSEGIDYSMAQWYLKLCNYDKEGWHADPYIGREFYGIWGNYKVNIKMDPRYCVAATGVQINSGDVNCESKSSKSGKAKEWIFEAKNVHDFVWAADPDYTRDVYPLADGRTLQFYYQAKEKYADQWKKLPAIMDTALQFMEQHFGPYTYPTYSFIQGGDGGMEYPMATLITGNRSLHSLVGVSIHEWMHSWYQMMLATNESKYAWMDEGFTSYAEALTMNYLAQKNLIDGLKYDEFPFQESVIQWVNFCTNIGDEPLSVHADHFKSNRAYGLAAYTKGSLTILELEYILGKETVSKGLLNYYYAWRFKHPDANDFFRVMEKTSNVELDWFRDYWVYTTDQVDYSLGEPRDTLKTLAVLDLKRIGTFPMPIQLRVIDNKDKVYQYFIPLDLMRNVSQDFSKEIKVLKAWNWVNPGYQVLLPFSKDQIKEISIDPDVMTIDVDRDNNIWKP